MSEKLPSRDEALEAMDFIVNILKEHEKDLDRLINELGSVTSQLGETGELGEKVSKIERKIDGLQNEIAGLIKRANSQQILAHGAAKETPEEERIDDEEETEVNDVPILLQCKQWEDFLALASHAQTLSFTYKEADRMFEASALRNNQVITYSGEFPKVSSLLKMWLSKQLDVSEKRILEGGISLG